MLVLLTETTVFLKMQRTNVGLNKVMHCPTVFHDFTYVQGKVDKEKSVLKYKEFRVTTRSLERETFSCRAKPGLLLLKAWLLL